MKINDFENNECLYQFTVKSAYNIIYHYPFKPEEKVTIWQKITGKSKITQHRVTPPVRKNFLYQFGRSWTFAKNANVGANKQIFKEFSIHLIYLFLPYYSFNNGINPIIVGIFSCGSK